jgi:hypothetical protein
VYLTASNPNLNSAGVNVFPALVRAHLDKGMVLLIGVARAVTASSR